MTHQIKCYFYGDPGPFDLNSPAYILNQSPVGALLYHIAANPPFQLNSVALAGLLNQSISEIQPHLEALLRIQAIQMKNDCYRLTFTVILNQDLKVIESACQNVHTRIAEAIESVRDQLISLLRGYRYYNLLDDFDDSRWLYHILCDQIFDGTAFDYFEKRGLMCSSKEQPGGRNYLIYGFEDSAEMEHYSNLPLCSSNNYQTPHYTFNSFGNSKGNRKDFFRFFKQVQNQLKTVSASESLNLQYILLNDIANRSLAEDCGRLMEKVVESPMPYDTLDDAEMDQVNLLIELGYLQVIHGQLTVLVPIFHYHDKDLFQQLSNLVLDAVFPIVEEEFKTFYAESDRATFVAHEICEKEVAVELWHQFFGAANERLAANGLVSNPQEQIGQGRCFRSFIIKQA